MIEREDMLELTRRMSVKRHCFSRIAGCYLDEEREILGTFNTGFLKQSRDKQAAFLRLAKQIPFAATNEALKSYAFSPDKKNGSPWQLLLALRDCGLKNDGLLEIFYEMAGERISRRGELAMAILYGSYDVPVKAGDKERLDESEEVYSFLLGFLCPMTGDYEFEDPFFGFLFPAFTDRSSDEGHICIYRAPGSGKEDRLTRFLLS